MVVVDVVVVVGVVMMVVVVVVVMMGDASQSEANRKQINPIHLQNLPPPHFLPENNSFR